MLKIEGIRNISNNQALLRTVSSRGVITGLLGGDNDGLYRHLLRKSYHASRPVIDFCISFICLLIASPSIFVVGILIKLTSRGPVFYAQERVGLNGRIFKIIKLRTMMVDSESQTGAIWAKKDDLRVTTFGRFLRRTHLDELPQLINVIRGDMSIIGPRPERPIFVEEFKEKIPGYTRRLSVKPGITDLAQCYYKYDENMQDVCRKLRYDMTYIKKMCWMLDLKIILLTALVSTVWSNGRS